MAPMIPSGKPERTSDEPCGRRGVPVELVEGTAPRAVGGKAQAELVRKCTDPTCDSNLPPSSRPLGAKP